MFFLLAKQEDLSYPNIHKVSDNAFLMLDDGWDRVTYDDGVCFVKGYIDDKYINQEIENIVRCNKTYTGNFCVICVSSDSRIKILNDIMRSFPIMYNKKCVTNLPCYGIAYKTAWADKNVTMHSDLRVVNSYGICEEIHNKSSYNIDYDNNGTDADIIDKIDMLLDTKIKKFAAHYDHIKCFLTGGLDSMLIYSYLKKHTSVDLIWEQHFEYDYFWCNHHTDILQSNLTYPQLHHWKKPSVLVSGTSGDETMLREPTITSLYLQYNNTDLIQELANDNNYYHASYLTDDEFMNKMTIQAVDHHRIRRLPYDAFINVLIDMVVNNMQHHHLGHTLTYTPLRDLQLFMYFCQLSFDRALSQITDGQISKLLINRNDPSLLQYISTVKNDNILDARLCPLIK